MEFFLLFCLLFGSVHSQIDGSTIHPKFPSTRIIGGTEVIIGSIPYVVSLRHNLRHICGGAILTPSIIITAAHCIEVDTLQTLSIIAGVHDIRYPESMSQERNTSRKIVHPDYDDWTMFNDLAIIELTEPLNLGAQFRTGSIPLASADFNAESGTGTVSGWGTTNYEEEEDVIYTGKLHTVDVPIINDTYCQSVYGETEYANSMICAGDVNGSKDFCEGDHGSPFVCRDSLDLPFLCGVASWGYGCARPDWPSVYTDVASYREWLDNNILLLNSSA